MPEHHHMHPVIHPHGSPKALSQSPHPSPMTKPSLTPHPKVKQYLYQRNKSGVHPSSKINLLSLIPGLCLRDKAFFGLLSF